MKLVKLFTKIFLFILVVSCTGQKTDETAYRKRIVDDLITKINKKYNFNAGYLTLKYDLFNANNDDISNLLTKECPISDLYLTIINKQVSRDRFNEKIDIIYNKLSGKNDFTNLLKERINQLSEKVRISKPPLESMKKNNLITKSYYDNLKLILNEKDLKNDNNDLFSKLKTLDKIISSLPITNPLPTGQITSNYGIRKLGRHHKTKMHNGIDISADKEAKAYAAASGIVKFAGISTGYGNLVIIEHKLGFSTYYAHLKEISVHQGEYIEIGNQVGIQGSTGRSTNDHLHYEVRINGIPHNPSSYLAAGKDCLVN